VKRRGERRTQGLLADVNETWTIRPRNRPHAGTGNHLHNLERTEKKIRKKEKEER